MSDDTNDNRGDDQDEAQDDEREDDLDVDQDDEREDDLSVDQDDDREDDELTWAEKGEKYGRAWVKAEIDPYAPDPELERYLNETDTSLDNEDLGLDKDGNRNDE